ncbi:DM13 domain-containing protein [Pseudoalteromonas phenolica]|uniref:DM13 domain-containing protein n=1 Tax=Pseudoalteromonas phenolica TaxID=161398 RepID=UPI001F0FAB9C|nr:DM13 domain-containing protein [Pseudoalteromonas phenolica]
MDKLKSLILVLLIYSLGFVSGIYTLPILMAPSSPSMLEFATATLNTKYQATIPDSLSGSDFLHYGVGTFSLSEKNIIFQGKLAPGPDYQIYLSPSFVEDEAQFLQNKQKMVRVGEVKSFNGFILEVPKDVDINKYSSLVIWCEAFREFITAANYKKG